MPPSTINFLPGILLKNDDDDKFWTRCVNVTPGPHSKQGQFHRSHCVILNILSLILLLQIHILLQLLFFEMFVFVKLFHQLHYVNLSIQHFWR